MRNYTGICVWDSHFETLLFRVASYLQHFWVQGGSAQNTQWCPSAHEASYYAFSSSSCYFLTVMSRYSQHPVFFCLRQGMVKVK